MTNILASYVSIRQQKRENYQDTIICYIIVKMIIQLIILNYDLQVIIIGSNAQIVI